MQREVAMSLGLHGGGSDIIRGAVALGRFVCGERLDRRIACISTMHRACGSTYNELGSLSPLRRIRSRVRCDSESSWVS